MVPLHRKRLVVLDRCPRQVARLGESGHHTRLGGPGACALAEPAHEEVVERRKGPGLVLVHRDAIALDEVGDFAPTPARRLEPAITLTEPTPRQQHLAQPATKRVAVHEPDAAFAVDLFFDLAALSAIPDEDG